ncbi:LOW QUALITY PROTEIN: disintegrin and metalloproteinase domain-containing protein unc-71 [Nilaparvata lugens]|uniref:LOW QUALITY PROTEIN: disintegrin and metalloproteinase domain-containing protein unc-71 n=2 Tax=Nilaparvata lugens TaxID=108931 RepID=UPI00193DC902|nr:LOW QUALITY PROTEIN: disintegrin and metalloproteinase domain-containing protein unc-71 [Nilaparvata lugens]
MGPDAGAYVTVPGSCFLALFFLFLNFTQCFPPVRTLPAAQNKREADYTLDDSFWNEENPVGEVERLLREFRQNQELVRNIGAHYYQIIYPVQLRHHEKMGISTREVGQPKYPNRYDSVYQSGGPAAGRVRSRQAGKHFHHTSLLIKAFNHKFRLDLELNTQLLAPNLMQKHYLQNGAEQVSKQEIEHCYYHGTVKDYPGASAAFHTCNGVSGVIHVGNETFVIHPFFGGDLSKHPHVIFEARTKANKGCANTGNYEWRMGGREGVGAQSLQFTSSSSSQARGKREARRNRGTSPSEEEKRWRSRNPKEEERKRNKISKEKEKNRNRSSKEKMWRNKTRNPEEEGWWRSPEEMSRRRRRRSAEEEEYWRRRNGTSEETRRRRERRDVSVTTKYIETALVIDKAMFEKRNGSTRLEVVHDAIQVANIADLYFRTMNTRVSVVYIETWQGSNQAVIDKSQDINIALLNFKDYTQRHLFRFDKDTTQLLTGEIFASGEAGMAVPQSICTPKSVGLSVDVNSYELHLLAGTMAHMIGHNIGMAHDKPDCLCNDWHGCIMNPSIVGLENVQPYKFSACSLDDYNMALRTGRGLCLLNKPNELEARRTCGNNKIEEGEDCDCGPIEQCADKCCDPITCKLRKDAECASGPCCNKCRLRPSGVVCREASNECDLPEFCTGESGHCPTDVHKKNGHPCDESKSPKKKAQGYCYNGMCPSINVQCANVWGHGAKSGDEECFRAFNSKGSINGHCGTDGDQYYVKCESDNAICGSLQCQNGKATPLLYNPTANPTLDFATTIISIKGMEFECKTTSGTKKDSDLPPHGLVRDGTPCGENLICVNQSCVSIYPYMDPGHCPSNHKNHECSANGVCSNTNKCHCNMGWGGPDCSLKVDISLYTFPSTEATLSPQDHLDATRAKEDLEKQMKSKVTPYENYHSTNTVFLVGTLMSVVGGVFIVFALMALCYRSVVVHKNFSLCLR